jgi:2-succinyl-6-hydroxy-2,4-cyclohexadiene-1-carboxylate synthase
MAAPAMDWNVIERGNPSAAPDALTPARPLLLVHGFTGSTAAWEDHEARLGANRRLLLVDLPGHGRTHLEDPDAATVERSAADLATILLDCDAAPADVLGYSLGARIARRLAIAHPEVVARLVLESPSAGIEDPDARARRRVQDEALAVRIEQGGITAFVDEWEQNPVFASHTRLSEGRRRRIRTMRLANDPAGLAASLRAAGQGRMEPVHGRLVEVIAPTLVITGSLDGIGRPRAEQVAAGIPEATLAVVEDAGHTPHDEQPEAFDRLVEAFLQEDRAA